MENIQRGFNTGGKYNIRKVALNNVTGKDSMHGGRCVRALFIMPIHLASCHLETTDSIFSLHVVGKRTLIYVSKTLFIHRIISHLNDCRFRRFLDRNKLSLQNICNSFSFLEVEESNSPVVTTGGEEGGILIEFLFFFYSNWSSGSGLYSEMLKRSCSNPSAGGSPAPVGD